MTKPAHQQIVINGGTGNSKHTPAREDPDMEARREIERRRDEKELQKLIDGETE